MLGRWTAAVLILGAFVRAQSTPAPCPADRPVDDFIAESKRQKSKSNPQNKGPGPQTVCSWEWCTEPGRTPPILSEPAPSSEVPHNRKSNSYTPEECTEATELAKEAAHDVEVGDNSFEQKNYAGALMRYRDAAKEKPGDPAIPVRLGRALEKLNQRTQASEQYKAATKLAESGKWYEEAHAALLRLQEPAEGAIVEKSPSQK